MEKPYKYIDGYPPCLCSTPGCVVDVQYTGGHHEYIGGFHEYTGGCSVHWGICEYTGGLPWWVWGISWVHWGMLSTPGEYHEYTGGLLWWVWGDIMSTPEGVQYTRGLSWVHWGDTKMHVGSYVSVNSKPDHPPRQNPLAIFWWANSPPPGKKGVQNPHPQAYKSELKPHPQGIFLNYSL